MLFGLSAMGPSVKEHISFITFFFLGGGGGERNEIKHFYFHDRFKGRGKI